MRQYASRRIRLRLRLAIATIVLSAAIIYAYASGPDPRYTGAPGYDPKSRARSGCHTGTAINAGGGNVVVNFSNGLTYTPGVQPQLTIVKLLRGSMRQVERLKRVR